MKALLISVLLILNVSVWAHGSKKTKQVKVKQMNPIVIKIDEEKTVLGTLKIKFVRFGHEHVSSGPGQPFSASVGVYQFKITDGEQVLEHSIYTNAKGESNKERIFDRYEIKLLKAAPDQRTVTMTVDKLK